MPVLVYGSTYHTAEEDGGSTVLSDDIWKKFELDYSPEEMEADLECFKPIDSFESITMSGGHQFLLRESCEIRHHDCMWAGLCISKEHNRTLPALKDNNVYSKNNSNSRISGNSYNTGNSNNNASKVPAGRSLLISKAQVQRQQQHLESDGDSTRPDTPQSSSQDSDLENDEQDYHHTPLFKHPQISINDKLSECMTTSVHVSEVTGQQVRRHSVWLPNADSWMIDEQNHQKPNHCHQNNQVQQIQNKQTFMTDHCYTLGIQTPSASDSEEEEIDVVSCDNKPALPQTTHIVQETQITQPVIHQVPSTRTTTPKNRPRPRGRPPSNATIRKRQAQEAVVPIPPPKRQRQQPQHHQQQHHTTQSKGRSKPLSRSSSDSEPDVERRSLHNNMERQRREDLKKFFDDLRRNVPEIQDFEKAPKVTILRQSVKYCKKLAQDDQIAQIELLEAQRRNQFLIARLNYLRRL